MHFNYSNNCVLQCSEICEFVDFCVLSYKCNSFRYFTNKINKSINLTKKLTN